MNLAQIQKHPIWPLLWWCATVLSCAQAATSPWTQWRPTNAPLGFQGSLLAAASDGSRTRLVDSQCIYAVDSSGHNLSPLVSTGDTKAIAWANGLWVATGSGRILTSTDGDEWTVQRLTGYGLTILAGGTAGWIACEEGTGCYWYSTDGAGWERRSFGSSFFPVSIAWGNGRWVASSTSGTVWSAEGQTWTAATGTASWISSLVWTGSRWMGVSSGTAVTSSDGADWTSETGNLIFGTTMASHGGTTICAGSFGRIYRSAASGIWSEIPSPITVNIIDVDWTGRFFLGTGNDGAVISSPDGISWGLCRIGTTDTLVAVAPAPDRTLVASALGFTFSSADSLDWAPLGKIDGIEDAVWTGSDYVLVGPSNIQSSTDGNVWSSFSPPDFATLRAVASNGQITVAVGDSGAVAARQGAGTWSRLANQGSAKLIDVEFGDNLFLAITAAGQAYRSSDGLVWEAAGSTVSLSAIAWTGDGFVGVSPTGKVVKTVNGSVWSTLLESTGEELYAVAGDGDTIVVAGWAALHVRDSSGVWIKQGSPGNVRKLSKNHTGFVGVGNHGLLAQSPDGKSWTVRLPAGTTGGGPVAWGNGRFVRVSGQTSADGESWTTRQVPGRPDLQDICYSESGFMAVGMGGAVCHSTDGIEWTTSFITGTPYLLRVKPFFSGYLAMGSAGAIAKFDPSSGWTTGIMTGISGNTAVVSLATSPASAVCVTYGNQLCSSTDGLTWTPRKGGMTNVLWDGSRFIASGITKTSVSNDGVIWVDQNTTEWPLGTWIGRFDGVYLIRRSGLSLIVGSPGGSWTEVSIFDNSSESAAYDGQAIVLGSQISGGQHRRSFAEWASASGIAPDGTGLIADKNGDGVPNGIAFLAGLPNGDAVANLVWEAAYGPGVNPGTARIEFSRGWPEDPGLVESLWFSPDLSSGWSKLAERSFQGWAGVLSGTTVRVVGDESDRIISVDAPGPVGAGNGFFRLGVSFGGGTAP